MKTTLLPYLENIKRMSKILSKFITELTDQSETLEVVRPLTRFKGFQPLEGIRFCA